MVTEIHNPNWQCPYCKENYEEHYDAEECAQECHLRTVEEPVKISSRTLPKWECEMCNNTFHCENDAFDCEAKHIKNEDKFYDVYNDIQSKIQLQNAAAHPAQVKLKVFP